MYETEIIKNSMYAIIPARCGSKGVKDKNIRCLQGYPLIAYSIAAAKVCSKVSRAIVSTDSAVYAKIAAYYGAEVPFLRPAELATDTSADLEFMEHAIGWLQGHGHKLPEFFMHLRPTTPIRQAAVMEDAAARMMADKTATSLRSAHMSAGSPYKWFRLRGGDGYYTSFVDGLSLDQANSPRQGFEPVYIPDGYVDILRTEFILKSGLLHGERMIGFVVPDSIDVDHMQDMEKAEAALEQNGGPLLEYLRKRYKPLSEVGF